MELGSATAQLTKTNAAPSPRACAPSISACSRREGLDTPEERRSYVALMAMGEGVMRALQVASAGDSIEQRLAALVVRSFALRVGRVLAAATGDLVLERLTRYIAEGRGFDA